MLGLLFLCASLYILFPRAAPQWLPIPAEYTASGDEWSVQEQDNRACKAGTRHYSGRVRISDEKNLFFWFFESRNEPATRPVMIWLNGGPGASSMFGLFGEIGPCLLNDKNSDTFENNYSWVNHANLLFIDQPAGTGLSTLKNTTSYPHTLDEASTDFSALLNIIFERIFPHFSKNDLYIAGESFAGRYIPKFAFDITQKQKRGVTDALNQNLKGIILADALVDAAAMYLGHYDML